MTRVVKAFDGAEGYDVYARVQRQVAERLAERILALPLPPSPRVLEIGCGTGFLADAVDGRLGHADWLMTDVAPAMVARAEQRFADRPGYRFAWFDGETAILGERFDLVCSNLAAQWFGDLGKAIAAQRRLLAPGGKLAMTTLIEGTFQEWRDAHRALGLADGIRAYPTMPALRALGAEEITQERILDRHPSGGAFLHALRAIGADTPRPGYRPLGPGAMRAVLRRFEASGAVARYHVATCIFGAPA